METTNPSDGLDRRIMNSIKYHATYLSRVGAVPGMERSDYEQELLLDLLHRQKNFRPQLSTFRTFADRLIRNRICSMTTPTHRLRAERQWTSFDVQLPGQEGTERVLAEVLPAERQPSDIALGMQIDVRRLVVGLSSELRDICGVLLANSVVEGAREAGISRSTVYDRAVRLREQAIALGLDVYVNPDTLEGAAVCNRRGPGGDEPAHAGPGETHMRRA